MKVSPSEIKDRKVNITYPYVEIVALHKALLTVMSCLDKGDSSDNVNLVASKDGVSKVVTEMSLDATNINLLLKTVGALKYHKSESEVKEIKSVEDYLEVF
jgi:hypothetical protein